MKNELGFNDGNVIERFIMDYEILFHIRQEIPDPIVKGGMSVPFHIPEKTVRRLSEDIDLVTPLSKEDTKSAMERVGRNTNGLFRIPAPYKPENPTKSLPLLTYFVPYPSSIGNPKAEVEVDIFYDFKETLPTKLVNSDTELMDFKLDYPVKIFDKNSLIGDKITTLGFNTIGLPEKRRSDAAKHIYDVGLLTRLIEDKSSVEELANIYEKTANYENSFNVEKFQNKQIIDDIFSSLDSLLVQGTGYSLESKHEGRYCTFKTQLLRKSNPYQKSSHINDILLIKLLSTYLRLLVYNKITSSQFADSFYKDLTRFKSISSQGGEEKKNNRKEIIQSFNTEGNRNFITTLPQAEQVFLFSKIEELKF